MAKRFRHFVTETLLWAAAGLGLISILLVIAAYTFNVSVILFRTGSMEPTIPTGSAALVREIPASEVEVGDILTVERPGQLPVTHRVSTIETGAAPEQRVITMQGDANASPDASPYTITEGKVMLGSIPGLAKFIHQLSNPYVLGSITLAAAVLVGWAFWPRSASSSSADNSIVRGLTAAHDPSVESPTPPQSIRSIGGFLTVVIAAPLIVNSSASSVVEETVSSQYITLTSVYDPTTRDQIAFDTRSVWDIGIDIDAPSEGYGRVGLQTQGDFPLQLSVLTCPVRWNNKPTSAAQNSDYCSGESQTLVENLVIPPNEELRWINSFDTNSSPWLRLLVSLPSGVEDQFVGKAGLRVNVEAAGEDLSTDTEVTPGTGQVQEEKESLGQDLARTGSPLIVLILAALGSMIVGRWFHSRAAKPNRRQGGESV